MQQSILFVLVTVLLPAGLAAADQKVTIRFQAMVGESKLACGQFYEGVGTTGSKITPHDFRFYVHNIRLIDANGKSVPVELEQDSKWQLDDLALLDFEDGTAGCINGTPDMNDRVVGTVPAGRYKGLQFTMGVPFEKNHTDLTTQPPPLNLTALAWVWNAGRKFARLDFASTGLPRGFSVHLGSTGCTPSDTKITVPTHCTEPNRPEVELRQFDVTSDLVAADLGALLKDTNVDVNQPQTAAGCMSSPQDSDCAGIFANLGLPLAGNPARPQTFFRRVAQPATQASGNR
ncbi:MAG TPA: MbnP family copper-binding protein [Bryobacteraceae bacterium]|nr:MbnP family copper-binding protein [Bryobacteraceae bacterium]